MPTQTGSTLFGYSMAALMLGLLFSLVGMGYAMYGKKIKMSVYRWTGWGLMLFPYVVTSTVPMILVGVLLMALPFALPYFVE